MFLANRLFSHSPLQFSSFYISQKFISSSTYVYTYSHIHVFCIFLHPRQSTHSHSLRVLLNLKSHTRTSCILLSSYSVWLIFFFFNVIHSLSSFIPSPLLFFNSMGLMAYQLQVLRYFSPAILSIQPEKLIKVKYIIVNLRKNTIVRACLLSIT